MSELQRILGEVSNWYSRLTGRERRLVGVAGVAVGVFLLAIVFISFSAKADTYRRRIADKMEQLREIQALSVSYREAESARSLVEGRLRSNPVRLMSHLEEKAAASRLELPTINPKGDVPLGGDGKIVESAVEVTLTDVSLDKLLDFLVNVETSPGMVKVKSVRLEPRNETLTAWVSIATYTLKP